MVRHILELHKQAQTNANLFWDKVQTQNEKNEPDSKNQWKSIEIQRNQCKTKEINGNP